MPTFEMPTMDEQFEVFSDNVIMAIEEWRKFESYKAQVAKHLGPTEIVKKLRVTVAKGGRTVGYSGNDLAVYADLDAAIEAADQSMERYMLAMHEMKAAFDKALQLFGDGGSNKTADFIVDNKDLVASTFSQGVAAKGAWDKGLGAVMPAYRKFKILSTK